MLQKQGAISNEDVRECKQRMNTFAYIGSIRDKPIVKCVYQTDVNENKFIIKGDGQAEDGIRDSSTSRGLGDVYKRQQPALQPGCVIRRENWTVLQKQGAISNEAVSYTHLTLPTIYSV